MLPIKKLYIDSRDRTPDSLSASNFRINLPYVVQTPDNTVFFITDVSIPHVWTTIESGINDKLYVWITKTVSPFDNTYYVVNMTPGNYTAATLASTLQASLNLIVPDNNNNLFTVTNTSGTNNLNIAINIAGRSVVLVSDAHFGSVPALANLAWVNGSVDLGNLCSMNDIIKNYSNKVIDSSHPYNVDFVNLHPINNVYITSPSLGSYDTLATFSQNVVKKVPVTVDYGYMIIDQFLAPNDYLDCSRMTMKTLEFHVRDGRGRYVNLHGAHISFSIVFNKWQHET